VKKPAKTASAPKKAKQ